MLPYALQLYSVREFAEKDFFDVLKKVKTMGYDGVEFAGLHGRTPEELKEYMNEIDLLPVSAHVSYNEFLNDPKAVLKAYSTIGCKYIAIPYIDGQYRPGGTEFDSFAAAMKSFGTDAAEYGITISYHNHEFEFNTLDGKYLLDIIYDEIPENYLKTQIDTCWVNVAGVDPVEYLLKYTGRAPTVHIKDFVIKDKKVSGMYDLIGKEAESIKADEGDFAYRPLGKGMQDIPALIEAAVKAGSEWLIIEQDNPSMGLDSMECAKISIDFIKSVKNQG